MPKSGMGSALSALYNNTTMSKHRQPLSFGSWTKVRSTVARRQQRADKNAHTMRADKCALDFDAACDKQTWLQVCLSHAASKSQRATMKSHARRCEMALKFDVVCNSSQVLQKWSVTVRIAAEL